ncbi:MAG: RDD family protein, partial [Phycisphaerales bacterium]|nr:RDD family protein [Phycisphaerales bacterium]
ASLPEPEDPWAMASLGDGPVLFERKADTFKLTTISPLQGVVGTPEDVVERAGSIDWMYMPMTLILIVLVLLAVPLARPFIESAPVEPTEDVSPMPLFARAAALVIDLIPGAMVAVALFPVSVSEFFGSFHFFELASGPPALVAIVVTGVTTTISEVLFGRSPGKMLVGGDVVSLDGSKPCRLQYILRGAVKTVVLMAPLVALLVILDPLSRGLPELISRTMVANRRGPGQPPSDVADPPQSD